jgi:RNA polymerase sigma factor (sigma-70 family)
MNGLDTPSLEQARRDRRARERFVEERLPALRAVAARYGGLNVPFDDLLQEGCIGLLEAVETFDSSRGVDFETYSRLQVRRAIRNALESPLEVLSDVSAVDPAGDAAANDDSSELAAAVSTLPERQREVVVRRFGLGCPPEDLGDVAASLHVSRQRARVIEQDALCALRDRLDPPRATEGEEPCTGTSSSRTDRSTGRHERSQRRSRRPSGRTGPTRTPSLR